MSEDLNSLVVIPPERPTYRAGRKPTAVRVYTVNQESRYLVVENVPALGLTKELLELFALYGTIEEYRYLDDYPCEEFTDVYWIKFQSLPQARAAKRKVDDHTFFSSNLRVRYGPEYETIEDTRQKLIDRRNVISIKTNEKKDENTLTQFQKTHPIQSNDAPLHPVPVIHEPPIPGVEYPTSFSTSLASTSYQPHTDPNSLPTSVNAIRQRINDASTNPTSTKKRRRI
ncbi:5925_t:CDS:2 [Funneliformis geosporum]|uniref:RNA-binding protein 48 n=1 Tax=Funneliformis geosporum TaxID=1117311 RepID=A0A9W4WSY3_9GLOM|nr:8573_t:CDS:2 [Funneliformis geosporum]CAI2185124.1 5925_t:CDS:2 [Funneliformis geosporum]